MVAAAGGEGEGEGEGQGGCGMVKRDGEGMETGTGDWSVG